MKEIVSENDWITQSTERPPKMTVTNDEEIKSSHGREHLFHTLGLSLN
jgi:hypothetical protein